MSVRAQLIQRTRDTFGIYWELVRIIVPVMVIVEILARLGAIRAMSRG